MIEGRYCWEIPSFSDECRSDECSGRCRKCDHDTECQLCPYYGCVKYPIEAKTEGEITNG